jgi:hypothetical protein
MCRKRFAPGHLKRGGADGVTRTLDLRITNALLCQLSYIGAEGGGLYIDGDGSCHLLFSSSTYLLGFVHRSHRFFGHHGPQ